MVYIKKVIKGASMQLTPIASNMTEIETSEARILFSYRTPVRHTSLAKDTLKRISFGQLQHQGTSTSGVRKMAKRSPKHVWIRWCEDAPII